MLFNKYIFQMINIPSCMSMTFQIEAVTAIMGASKIETDLCRVSIWFNPAMGCELIRWHFVKLNISKNRTGWRDDFNEENVF